MNEDAKQKETQAERFERVARELGCDDDPAALDRAMRQLDLRKPDNETPSDKDADGDQDE